VDAVVGRVEELLERFPDAVGYVSEPIL
jgi:hypothetical protein